MARRRSVVPLSTATNAVVVGDRFSAARSRGEKMTARQLLSKTAPSWWSFFREKLLKPLLAAIFAWAIGIATTLAGDIGPKLHERVYPTKASVEGTVFWKTPRPVWACLDGKNCGESAVLVDSVGRYTIPEVTKGKHCLVIASVDTRLIQSFEITRGEVTQEVASNIDDPIVRPASWTEGCDEDGTKRQQAFSPSVPGTPPVVTATESAVGTPGASDETPTPVPTMQPTAAGPEPTVDVTSLFLTPFAGSEFRPVWDTDLVLQFLPTPTAAPFVLDDGGATFQSPAQFEFVDQTGSSGEIDHITYILPAGYSPQVITLPGNQPLTLDTTEDVSVVAQIYFTDESLAPVETTIVLPADETK
jgi:hypothetical protein